MPDPERADNSGDNIRSIESQKIKAVRRRKILFRMYQRLGIVQKQNQGWKPATTNLEEIRKLYFLSSSGSAEAKTTVVNEHRRGYPQLAVLMSMSGRYKIFRRFNVIRLRMLLYKQDEVAQLEERLKSIDDGDPKDLFLGSRRHDRNTERMAVMKQLEQAIASYGP